MGERLVGLVVADHHAMFTEGLGIILDAETDLAMLGVPTPPGGRRSW